MIKIIFEDEFLLVINKPAGLRSIEDGYDPSIPHIRSLLEPNFGKLWMVHRLDKETSGVMLIARSASAHKILNDQFSHREIQKQYLALIYGVFPETLSISYPLKVNGDRHHRTVVDAVVGKLASTDFARFEITSTQISTITAMPHSGYTHQIRAHLLAAGYPILCDPLYYSLESRKYSLTLPLKRTALHASQLIFQHPNSGEILTFTAEISEDLLETIKYLKKTEHPI